MNHPEPRPWLSEVDGNSPLRELLESAAADEPTVSQLALLEAKLGPMFGPPGGTPPADPGSAAGSTGGAAASVGGGLGALKTLAVVSVTAAVVGTGAFQAGRHYEQQLPKPPPPPVARVEPPPAPKEEPAAPPPLHPVPVDRAALPARPAPVKRSEPPVPARPEVEVEALLLEQAMSAVQSGQPQQAKRHLEEHQQRFPQGALRQEREVLWVQTLVALGEVETARERADRFKQQWPTSPHVRRIESLLP